MLAVALVCTGISAVANWWTRIRPNQLVETISKPLTTVLVMWVLLAADGPTNTTVLGLIALLFCLIGDIALMDVVDNFVAGLAAFLVGHLVFIGAFVTMHLPHPFWALPVAVVLLVHAAVVGRRIVAGAVAQDAALRIPVVAYLVVILSMAIVGTMTGNWWAIVGALLFVLSDTVLGWRAFVREKSWMALVVMVTYHGAIVSLALSVR